ncbi:GNAT family N-acetyltransferase [Asanoa siamensis]|uniref:N-acetyltransferase n=1 Tax=Asanoa siamensis TaxID=926357 RepID=A0ABQ4CSW2_9ACTN|nr:GNAT family N-acetyltransferase [Asanoa siamensis]GIF74383.1 N-acetyltransferase [Asanoa siamensis]
METVVNDNPGRNRFEISADGEVAGFAAYRLREGAITFTHTEIDPRFEGKGLGSKLARAVLDEARSRQLRVYAQCPFVAGYIDKHPEYQDLLAGE